MYLRRCAKCGALRREPRLLGFVKTEVELVCRVNSFASETRNPLGSCNAPCGRQLTSHGQSRSYLRTEGSIHRPRGLSVLYCPFSDGPPLGKGWRKTVQNRYFRLNKVRL